MKVVIASVQVPYIKGGAEEQAGSLRAELARRGCQAEIVTIPFKWYPAETVLRCMVMGRLMDLTEMDGKKIDLVIALKFPAYYLQHPCKVVWLLHQHRQAYDLWGTEFGDIHKWPEGEYIRKSIIANDCSMLPEARRLYTISQNVSTRLRKFNGLHAEPLYHPPALWNVLKAESYERFIFYPSRITPIKRQRLIVEAARYFDNGVRVILAGKDDSGELEHIRRIIHKHNLEDRIVLPGFLTEEEKIDLYARCGAVYFGGYDEDYGYIPLEGMFASKPVITHSDAGGALEFVRDGENGRVTAPDPERLAEAVNHLFSKPEVLPELGRRGRETMRRKQVSWDFVLDRLLEPARG